MRAIQVAIATSVALTATALSTCDGGFPCDVGGVPLYKLADQPVDDRVSDLLSRMTVEEKVAQMLNPVMASYEYFAANFSNTSVGTIYSGLGGATCGSSYACQNAIQALFLNSSRLGIPASFIGETLHSGGCSGGTIFPVPVLLGATFDLDLVSRIGTSIARQARACGIDRGLSPVLQVDTDPRFGRFEEAYGEDPFLVSVMGVAMAAAHQGNVLGPSAYINDTEHFACEAKHALAYGYGGRDWYRADMTETYLFDVYGRPWRDFLRKAGGRGLMVAHPEVNGLPLHGNRRILTDVLRTWFAGSDKVLQASDWGNVGGIVSYGVAADYPHAAMLAAWSGLDQEMQPAGGLVMPSLVESVNAGLINVSYIDRAAGNSLREKFATRLFDGPEYVFVNESALPLVLDQAADRELAYEAAASGIVLLQNNGILPLTLGGGSKIQRVAVLGPNGGCAAGQNYPCPAEVATVGHYVSLGAPIQTVVDAVANASAALGFNYTFQVGASIETNDTSLIPAAVAAAAAADVTFIVIGDDAGAVGKGTCSEMSDADTVDIPGSQLQLVDAVLKGSSAPVVVILLHCRPATFGAGPQAVTGPYNGLLSRIPAVVAAWRPGEAGGRAVLDVITGAVNPSGKLTQNWVRSVGAVRGPESPYIQIRGGTSGYWDEPSTPLFPFGHGLSYTTFEVSGAAITPNPSHTMFTPGDVFNVSGTIKSSGPAGRITLFAFFSQRSPTKVARFASALCGFGKFDVPANSAGTPFSFTVAVSSFEGYEPAVEDFVVYTGEYIVTLATDAAAPSVGNWPIQVNGSYTWVWDFTQ